MPIVRLTSLEDPRVADYRGVRDPELLADRGLFVAEGRLVVRRLLQRSPYPVRSVLLSETALAALRQTNEDFPPPDIPVYVVRTSDFAALSGVHIHRGCLALGVRPSPPVMGDLLRTARLVLVLESVANADNVGGLFRNAEAFGVDSVLLDPRTCDPLYRKAIRTSAGASLTVPFTRIAPWPAALVLLRSEGFTCVALSPGRDAVPLDTFAARPLPARLAILVGSEGIGLTPEARSLVEEAVRIPMVPGIDSLNVAVAAGIALSRLSLAGKAPDSTAR
jgi:tRNA G18 (ribose-2'-O)-methylase SpoU